MITSPVEKVFADYAVVMLLLKSTQQEVITVEDVKERIEDLRSAGRSGILLSIYRRGQYVHVPIKLDDDDEDE